jgi:hypothetical protein
MASGRLGTARLVANVDTVVYLAPHLATINICALNQGTSAALVKVALSLTDIPSAGDYIEAASVPPNGGVLERFGVMISAGERVIVRADKDLTVDIRVHGPEGVA